MGYYLGNYLNKMKSFKTVLKHKSFPQQVQPWVTAGVSRCLSVASHSQCKRSSPFARGLKNTQVQVYPSHFRVKVGLYLCITVYGGPGVGASGVGVDLCCSSAVL